MITGASSLFYGLAQPAFTGGTLALNTANTWTAVSFIATETSISGLYLSLATLTGTVGNVKITVSLRANDPTINRPGTTVIGSDVEVTGGWTANKLNAITASWTGLTLGASYWIIVKNTSAAPNTDYPTLSFSMYSTFETSGPVIFGQGRYNTTDAGSTWGVGGPNSAVAVKFASGRLSWFPKDATSISDIGIRVYSDRKTGVVFRSPNTWLAVNGAVLPIRGTGTPPNAPYCELWVGGIKKATSSLSPTASSLTGGGSLMQLWPFDNVIVPPNSEIWVVVGMAGGDSSNSIYFNARYAINDDAVLKAAKPCNGTMSKIYWDGSSWTTTTTEYGACMLLCDPTAPIAAAPLNRRRYYNRR